MEVLCIGEQLLNRGLIGEDQLYIARREQQRRALPLEQLVVDLGFVAAAAVRALLSEQFACEAVDLQQCEPSRDALACLSLAQARRFCALPLSLEGDSLTLAVAELGDLQLLDQLRWQLAGDYQLQLRLADAEQLKQALERYYREPLSLAQIVRELDHPAAPQQEVLLRLLDTLLAQAVEQQASDIHLQPEARFLRIRYRVDGVLRQVLALHSEHWPALCVRLKVMAELDIAETRAAQDGRFSRELGGRCVDFRIAVQPCLYGENIVLRVLDRQGGTLSLPQLGLDVETLQSLQQLLQRPEGLVLVTGPTGSGKTTSLYAMLRQLPRDQLNIATLEDPVEYPQEGWRQTALDYSAKLDYAGGVRAILRQDPDVILIGEIRDAETAAMALRAALTGHRVYSTLHCASALRALPRLYELGLSPASLAANLSGLIAQRLLRRLCDHCKRARPPSSEEQVQLQLSEGDGHRVYQARGCEHCQQLGYRGRIAVMELVLITPALQDLISSKAPYSALQRAAQQAGMHSLARQARRRVLRGEISPQEASRVIHMGEAL